MAQTLELTPEEIIKLKLLLSALDTIDDLVFVRQKAGVEDMMFGIGATSQVRGGENVTINKIDSSVVPFTSSKTVQDSLTEIYSILLVNKLNINSGS